ncbi:PTS transporter subunit EIIC [Spiroplasma endosymbiont of Aspidapion aeneum]|uniref:PTS transporter subunit EIIC n=1 Tax=Spiroplasma endosymbiont of Aspidapion aeneum TaxID=3066276 RepID=UPI00313CFEC4
MKEKKDSFKTASDIYDIFQNSIMSYTNCMTRLRIKVNEDLFDKIKIDDIKSIKNVIGVIINNTEFQIVLGVGFVNRVASDFKKILEMNKLNNIQDNIFNENSNSLEANRESNFIDNKFDLKNKNKNNLVFIFNKFGNIFTPLIPAFLAAGILQAIGSIILTSYGQKSLPTPATSWVKITTLLLSLLIQILCVIIGWNAAKEFGGTPIIGAILASMYTPLFGQIVANVFVIESNKTSANFIGIHINDISNNWFTVGIFRDKKADGLTGSILGAITISIFASFIQVEIEKVIPDSTKLILTPLLVCIICLMLQFILFVPISGYMFKGMSFFFKQITTNKWLSPWLGAILAFIFLWLVVFGIHQGLTPIYLILISDTGLNTLFPIVAMAGAGQVGSSAALFVKAKKGSKLRAQIASAIFPGILGIGEPLIYGIMLPRLRAFLTSCLGAAVGGLFIGMLPLFGIYIGTTAIGCSGLLALPLLSSSSGQVWVGVLFYLAGLIVTYFSSFVITYLFGTKGVDLN